MSDAEVRITAWDALQIMRRNAEDGLRTTTERLALEHLESNVLLRSLTEKHIDQIYQTIGPYVDADEFRALLDAFPTSKLHLKLAVPTISQRKTETGALISDWIVAIFSKVASTLRAAQ